MAAPSTHSPGMFALPESVPEDSAFQRLWRGFMTARMTIAIVLLLLFLAVRSLAGTGNPNGWIIGLCLTYLVATAAVRAFTRPLPPGRAFDPQWVYTIGVDLLAFGDLVARVAGPFDLASAAIGRACLVGLGGRLDHAPVGDHLGVTAVAGEVVDRPEQEHDEQQPDRGKGDDPPGVDARLLVLLVGLEPR